MSQINITKSGSFIIPPSGYKGLGFLADGALVIINEDGSTTAVSLNESTPPNIIANRGVGLLENLPNDPSEGDIYVTTDTFNIYTGIDSVNWDIKALSAGQLVSTLNYVLYQFFGTELRNISGKEERDAEVDVTGDSNYQDITFDSVLPDNNYRLLVQAIANDGTIVLIKVNPTYYADRFQIQTDFPCKIKYNAKYLG